MTPRDRLQRVVDLGRKTRRYWWLVVLFAIAGGALSLAFALVRPKNYQSYAVLFYQERIRSSLLQGREEQQLRGIGDRYRELLLARGQLAQVIADPKLNPFSFPAVKKRTEAKAYLAAVYEHISKPGKARDVRLCGRASGRSRSSTLRWRRVSTLSGFGCRPSSRNWASTRRTCSRSVC